MYRNQVILEGFLGKSPDIRFMPSGDKVANVTLATKEVWKDKAGRPVSSTEWHALVFYAERAALQTESADEETAARVLFLNRTCFNGLWRVNSKGAFNASWCRNNPRPRIVFATRLHACSRALRGVTLLHADYREALADVRQGDVVFLDPPYIPVSDTADFTAYAAGGFDDGAQVAIRDEANRLRSLGACVLACNADVPRARALWAGWPLTEVKAKRGVNSDANKRGPVGELLIGGV